MKESLSNHCTTDIPALYIHIPFCRKVCPFCSFAVLKDNLTNHAPYFELLTREFELLKEKFSFDFTGIESIYIGGGTPSRLSISELQQLVDWIILITNCDGKIHWSIEVNPEDMNTEYAQNLKSMGFTRISLGIQSFRQSNLKKLQRIHTDNQSRSASESIIKAGFKDYNFDLMFGFPGQSIESLEKDLEQALSYKPSHVSVYSLNIEPKTALNRKPAWKEWIRKNEDLISDMYFLIVDRLTTSNLLHYEVSNFCINGYQSRQNMVYWNRRNYLGLGLGAHSFVSPYRWGNMKRLVDYKTGLNSLPRISFEKLDEGMQRDEEVMLSLRLSQGLEQNLFKKKYRFEFPKSWVEKVELYHHHQLLEIESDRLYLTTKGLLIADEITASLCACLP